MSRMHLIPLVALVLFPPGLFAQCTDPAPPAAGFSVAMATFVTTFSDGAQTTVDIRRPSVAPGPCGWPMIVLVHGGGGNRGVVAGTAESLAARGYLTVAYDVRGQGSTPALNPPTLYHDLTGLRELIDLFEVMERVEDNIPSQVDFDRIGVTGYSQGARHSWWAAMHSGQTPPTNPWRSATFPTVGAIVARDNAAGPGSGGMFPAIPNTIVDKMFSPGGIQFRPLQQAAMQTALLAENYTALQNLATAPGMDPTVLLPNTTVPVYAHASYDDKKVNPSGVVNSWNLLPVDTPKRLQLGTGGHDSPNNAQDRERYSINRLRWFNRFLKDHLNGVDTEPRVFAAVTPDVVADYQDSLHLWDFREDEEFPMPATTTQRFFLDAGSSLSLVAPAGVSTDTITHSVPAAFDMAAYTALLPNANQLRAIITPSAITYDTPTLNQDRHLQGEVELGLNVLGTASDYQVCVTLLDVDPAGITRFVSRGREALRGVAGPQAITLSTYVQSYVFRQGHQIRVRIENLDVHRPPTGSAPFIGWVPFFASTLIDVRSGGMNPSYVDFPFLPFAGPTLSTAPLRQSVAALENQRIGLHTSSADAGAPYLLMASLSGSGPTPFLGVDVPLTFDPLTFVLLANPATPPFVGFAGALDGNGSGEAGVALAGLAPPTSLVGLELDLAALVLTGAGLEVTNGATMTLVP